MKLILQREQLLKPLQLVMGAVDHKQAMPILSNILLNVSNNVLSITGTDLEIELVGQSPLTHPESTHVNLTLPARKLLDICKALPEASSIELYHENDRVILKSNRSRFTVSTLSASDFPTIKSVESHVSFSITQGELHALLHRTAFAMAQQDVRYYLNGTLLEIADGTLRLVTTDGHRLALSQTQINANQPHRLQVIIPYKAVMELMRLLKEADALLTVEVSHHHIRIVGNDFVFTSKLVEGRFPDYQRVIPKKSLQPVIADRDTLKQALLRASILCHDKVRGVRFELQSGNLKLSANNPEQEAAEEEMDIHYTGEHLDIRFNITYLLDVLNVMQPGPVHLTFIDTNHTMRIDDPNDAHSIFVVMPMRL